MCEGRKQRAKITTNNITIFATWKRNASVSLSAKHYDNPSGWTRPQGGNEWGLGIVREELLSPGRKKEEKVCRRMKAPGILIDMQCNAKKETCFPQLHTSWPFLEDSVQKGESKAKGCET